MTRLIDADVLIGYVNKYDTGGPIGKALRAMLEKSPTVDAIPIAMIQREIDNWDRKKPQSFHAIAYRHLIEDWGREQGILETTRNYSKRGNGDPNGFNEETVQALKDTTERKNLSKVYETLDDMYADMGYSEWREYIYRERETADGVDSDRMGELIRCRDCKRWNKKDGMFKDIDGRQWHECPHLEIPTDEWFFCKEAKRREDD